jgi:hypothetical protein
MRTSVLRLSLLVLAFGVALLSGSLVEDAAAIPDFFDTRCAFCHSNDTRTCDGCHEHKGTLSATPSLPEYAPGDPVTITLSGGSLGGWIRAILYDHTGTAVDWAHGPTWTGDDHQPNPVLFPLALNGTAPAAEGNYVWEAAWFGGNNDGSGHSEVRTPVTIRVVQLASVEREDREEGEKSWSRIKSLYR